jgi:hypothetical protein
MPHWSKRGASGPEKRKLVHGARRPAEEEEGYIDSADQMQHRSQIVYSFAEYQYIDIDYLSESIAARTTSDEWNGQGVWTTLSAKLSINVVHKTQAGTQRDRTSMPYT